MNGEEYFARMQSQLKGLSSDQQAEILAEIRSHWEEGQDDVQLGDDLDERQRRVEVEMGEPELMGKKMQKIYRRNRWVDYALIVLPSVILYPILQFIVIWLIPSAPNGQPVDLFFQYWSVRAIFLLNLALIGIGVTRYRRFGAAGVGIYWIVETWWSIVALGLREQRLSFRSSINASSTGLVETIFWLAVLAGLGYMVIQLEILARDPQLIVLALLPFTVALGNMVTGQMLRAGGFPIGYQIPDWKLLYFGPGQIAFAIWPALFFLFSQRSVGWFGLLVYAVPLALINQVASFQYPGLVLLWSLPVLLVMAGWGLEMSRTRMRGAVQ